MKTQNEVLNKDLQLLTTQLKTLRDDVRVQVHLAGLEAKEMWRKLEPELDRASELAQDASAVSLAAVKDALVQLRKLSESLTQGIKPRNHSNK